MNDPVQLAPLLAIYEDEGDYTIRVAAGARAKALSSPLVKIIGELGDARKLTFITPLDTRVFRLGGKNGHQGSAALGNPDAGGEGGESRRAVEAEAGPVHQVPTRRPARDRISQDPAAPPSPELVEELEADEATRYAAEALREEQEAVREQRAQQRLMAQEAAPPDTPAPDLPEVPARRARQPRQQPVPNSSCGRCVGSGMLDGGGQCPVCRGTGQVAVWGSKRSR